MAVVAGIIIPRIVAAAGIGIAEGHAAAATGLRRGRAAVKARAPTAAKPIAPSILPIIVTSYSPNRPGPRRTRKGTFHHSQDFGAIMADLQPRQAQAAKIGQKPGNPANRPAPLSRTIPGAAGPKSHRQGVPSGGNYEGASKGERRMAEENDIHASHCEHLRRGARRVAVACRHGKADRPDRQSGSVLLRDRQYQSAATCRPSSISISPRS